ncbi:hypothetical protein Tco_1271311, partial [Tanacetum coccineum]
LEGAVEYLDDPNNGLRLRKNLANILGVPHYVVGESEISYTATYEL